MLYTSGGLDLKLYFCVGTLKMGLEETPVVGRDGYECDGGYGADGDGG